MEENKPYVSRGPNDLFEGDLAKQIRDSLSEEDKEKYRIIGEQLYGSIDYCNPSKSSNNLSDSMIEAISYIEIQLRAGLHPSFLEQNEKELLKEAYGKEWYLKWGYVEEDLNQIITLNPNY